MATSPQQNNIESLASVQQVVIDYSPATGEEVARVQKTDLSRFGDIVADARLAQQQWRTLSYKDRAKHINKMHDYIIAHCDKLAETVSRSNGKTRTDAMIAEVMTAGLSCAWYAKNTEKVLKSKNRGAGSLLMLNKRYKIVHQPLGVVGIISPWNYPLSIPFGEIVMALMAGNAVILKVTEICTAVSRAIEEIVAAGDLPEGLFTAIYGRGSEVSPKMLEHRLDKIFFTGSTNVGKLLMAQAAETLTPLSLELGGNDPMIVMDDADLERAANGAIWAGFQNAGQSCGGVERIYVYDAVYDEFVRLLAEKTQRLTHGCTSDQQTAQIGSLTTSKQRDTVKAHVSDALEKGARVIAESRPVGKIEDGFFHPAMVVVDVTNNMLIVSEETFGPVVAVMRVSGDEEAIREANDSQYCLTASVWTTDKVRGMAMAERIDGGVVTINDHLYTHGAADMPWGAWKDSGIGRTHGPEGLLEMVNHKAINWDWFPVKRDVWWHPHDKATYKALKRIVLATRTVNLIKHPLSTLMLLAFYVRKIFTSWK